MPAQAKTVLVVDDEEALRTLAAKLIEKRDHTVLTASNGTEALAVLAGDVKIDLLVLDVVMPGLSGLQTLEKLRNQGHTELPVVLLTAQSTDEDILGGYKTGRRLLPHQALAAEGATQHRRLSHRRPHARGTSETRAAPVAITSGRWALEGAHPRVQRR